jgi:hypothetical protein
MFGGMIMFTASGGYYLDGTSFIQNKPKKRRTVSLAQLCVFLSIFIVSSMFGAMVHAYATNEEIQTIHSAVVELTPAYETHIVSSGESLWKIANIYSPAHIDVRKYIHELKSINHLESSILQEGQRLLLPSIS